MKKRRHEAGASKELSKRLEVAADFHFERIRVLDARKFECHAGVEMANAENTACLPPLVTSTWFGATSYPESRRVLAAIASRSAGRPAAGV